MGSAASATGLIPNHEKPVDGKGCHDSRNRRRIDAGHRSGSPSGPGSTRFVELCPGGEQCAGHVCQPQERGFERVVSLNPLGRGYAPHLLWAAMTRATFSAATPVL